MFHSDSYGYKINKSIQERSSGKYELKEATLYSAFRRLEENGHITSYWGNEATGARRRYYRITEQGKKLFLSNKEEWKEAQVIINNLINLEVGDNE